jgi:uncharacterized peroxidase-related enzyme
MTVFPIHTIDSAPDKSRVVLQNVQATIGVIPNLAAAMAESPTLVRAFFTVREIYESGTLSAADIQVLSVANAVENDCEWCVAFHSLLAEKTGVSAESLAALRAQRAPANRRDKALTDLTRELIRQRGRVAPDSITAFLAAGFAPAQVLEVVLGIACSTMANYAQHVVQAPLDGMLAAHEWSRATPR